MKVDLHQKIEKSQIISKMCSVYDVRRQINHKTAIGLDNGTIVHINGHMLSIEIEVNSLISGSTLSAYHSDKGTESL